MSKLMSVEHVPFDGACHSPAPDRNRYLRLKVADRVLATFGFLWFNIECSRFFCDWIITIGNATGDLISSSTKIPPKK